MTNYVGGGVVAGIDTPSSTGVMVLNLNEGDYVEVFIYTAITLSNSYYAGMGYSDLGLFLQAMYLG